MEFKTLIEVDVQEAFERLNMNQQQDFLLNNIRELCNNDLIEAINQRGYKVIKE